MRPQSTILNAALLFFVLALLAACGSQVPAMPQDEVTVQLKWVHQAQFAGFYVAEQQGFYADENLDVTFAPGGIGIDIFEGVANGDVDFSVVGADALIAHRSEGMPVTAIATIYRINPFVLVAFADSGIRSPYDLVGRTVGLSDQYSTAQFNALITRLGLDPTQIHIVPNSYDNSAFLNGEVDAVNSYVAGSFIQLKEAVGDREIILLWPGDYGVHFYSDTIITSDRLVTENPDLVLRFLRATLKGHRFAIENPSFAVDASMLYAENQDRGIQESMLSASMPLIHTGADQIGWMQADVWQSMYDALLEQGLLKAQIDAHTIYTMEFLEAIYGEQS